MPSWRILEQSNAAGTSGLIEDLVVTLYWGCACEVRACEDAPTVRPEGFAVARSEQGDAGQRYEQAD